MSQASVSKRPMAYVRLGTSGLKVSRIILGCMSYGSPEWQPWVLGEEDGVRQIKEAYDLGIQTFDTANVYSNGLSEVVLGKAIKKYNFPREEIVVMTKVFGAVSHKINEHYYGVNVDEIGYVNQHGLSRKHIIESVKASLGRLGLEYIDVLQYYAITHNLTPFISMQNHYNLLYREEEREMIPTLKYFGVGSIPWSPLARGNLTRPLGEQTKRAGYIGAGVEDIINRVDKLAREKNVSMAQLSLAWLLHKDVVSAPIVGSTSVEKMKDIVGALDVELTDEEMKYLEEPYQPVPIFGH
ncbi:hypothetical protein EWM64_g4920 [Hericium alpestre]|uniref:NADP-dependent oxidoreductase domain-containing protein n=1 Tax=Hericium alpestre TaxID=135208 RepID=A0A4Y9ZW96_9AGAM|nr:hypothetical protein EWM64_g4920 [Hericium alpestre]